MKWKDAVKQAREEMGYSQNEYINCWGEIMELANDILSEWREENQEEYGEEIELNKEDYQEYLKSDRWKALRLLKLERSGFKCKDCGGIATEVHHKRYVNLRTPWEYYELVSLCRDCHRKRHGIRGGKNE